jgi:hypothetical protein
LVGFDGFDDFVDEGAAAAGEAEDEFELGLIAVDDEVFAEEAGFADAFSVVDGDGDEEGFAAEFAGEVEGTGGVAFGDGLGEGLGGDIFQVAGFTDEGGDGPEDFVIFAWGELGGEEVGFVVGEFIGEAVGGAGAFTGGEAEFAIEEPEGAFDTAEQFWGEVDDEGEEGEADGSEDEGCLPHEDGAGDDADVFGGADDDIGNGFGGGIDGEAGAGFGGVGDEGGAAGEEGDDDLHGGVEFAEDADGEEAAAYRSNEGVDGIPKGIDPGNFVGKKFEDKEETGSDEDGIISEDGEIGKFIGKGEEVEADGEPGDEGGEVEVDAGEGGEAEGDGEGIEDVHFFKKLKS